MAAPARLALRLLAARHCARPIPRPRRFHASHAAPQPIDPTRTTAEGPAAAALGAHAQPFNGLDSGAVTRLFIKMELASMAALQRKMRAEVDKVLQRAKSGTLGGGPTPLPQGVEEEVGTVAPEEVDDFLRSFALWSDDSGRGDPGKGEGGHHADGSPSPGEKGKGRRRGGRRRR